jgi:hypothetical protein
MRLREVAYSAHNCPPAVAAYGDDFQLEFDDEGEMARKDWGVSRKATFNGTLCFCKTLDLAAMPKASLRALVRQSRRGAAGASAMRVLATCVDRPRARSRLTLRLPVAGRDRGGHCSGQHAPRPLRARHSSGQGVRAEGAGAAAVRHVRAGSSSGSCDGGAGRRRRRRHGARRGPVPHLRLPAPAGAAGLAAAA